MNYGKSYQKSAGKKRAHTGDFSNGTGDIAADA